MDCKTGSQDIVDFVNKRKIDEIKALSKEHKVIFSKMPFVYEGISTHATKLLTKMAMYQKTTNVTNLNKESLFTSHAEEMLNNLKYQRHNLHLSQLIRDRESQNERDRKELENIEEELKCMKEDMAKLPSSEASQKEITVFKGKVMNYEKCVNDAKVKEEKLEIKPEIMPESLKVLIEELEALQHERDLLKIRSDNITIARSSKKDLLKLKMNAFEPLKR